MDTLPPFFGAGGTLFHAHLWCGDRTRGRALVLKFIEEVLAERIAGNPDIHDFSMETFGVDEAREVVRQALERPYGSGAKYFIIAPESCTHEAQNALLKIVEEPTPRTFFFFIVPRAELLLPTLRSRLMMVPGGAEPNSGEAGRAFIAKSPTLRLAHVAPIIEAKDREAAKALMVALEFALAEKTPKSARDRALYEKILLYRGYLSDRAPSLKMMLEDLALTA